MVLQKKLVTRENGGWNRLEKPCSETSQNASPPGTNWSNVSNQLQTHQTVHHALRDSCGLDAADYVLLVCDGNEKINYYTSPGLQDHRDDIITTQLKTQFEQSVLKSRKDIKRNDPGYYCGDLDDSHVIIKIESHHGQKNPLSEYRRRHWYRDPRSENFDIDKSRFIGNRRTRHRSARHRHSPAEGTPVPTSKMQPLVIGDDAEVESFYLTRFKDMQQSSCKFMGKTFVKLVEPKKQTHYPYTGGDDRAPPWWPDARGQNAVRHREPDHLLKPERIRLLAHILQLIVAPNERYPIDPRLEIDVKKLEETTMEALSNWFNDKDHPENFQKKKFLKEIFKVARAQERYKQHEIDGSTTIPVMCGDNRSMNFSDDEDEDAVFTDQDDREEQTGVTTEGLVSSSLPQQHLMRQHMPQHYEVGPPQRLVLSSRHEAHGLFPEPFSESQIFPSRMDINLHVQPQSPGFQDSVQRIFNPPGGYLNSQISLPSWSQQMINTSATSAPYYIGSSHSTHPHANQFQPCLQIHSQSAHHPFEGMPTSITPSRTFDGQPLEQNHNRTDTLTSGPYMPQSSYEYLQDNNEFGPQEQHQGMKSEPHSTQP